MRQRGLFFFSFLVSAALHLAGVALSEYGRSPRPPERPPVLQAKAPRFLPVERFSSSLPDPIRRQMQRLAQVAAPQAVPDAALPLGASTRLVGDVWGRPFWALNYFRFSGPFLTPFPSRFAPGRRHLGASILGLQLLPSF